MAEKVDLSKQTGAGNIKAAGAGAADKATGMVGGALTNAFAGAKGNIKELLNGLKASLGIPDIPKIPKKPKFPAVKKFEPKKPPQAKIYEKEEKKFDYAKAPAVQSPTPPPPPPKGKLAYKYEFNGKRISVGFYEGDRYVDAVGAFSFTSKVTEERAVQLFIQNYKAEIPNLESWGMQKL